MNITIISSLLPYPLNSGGAQAVFNMIDELRKVHHFSFIFPVNGKNTIQSMHELQKIWPEVVFYPYSYIKQLSNFQFLSEKAVRMFKLIFMKKSRSFKVERALKPYGFYFNHDFISFVNNIIKENKTELVQVEFYPYLHIINYLPSNIKCIFIHHEIRYIRNERLLKDVELKKQETLYYGRMKQEEISDLNKYDGIVTLTDIDKSILCKDGVVQPIFVSPAAINSELQHYKKWNGKLCFIGGYSHIPNNEGLMWFISKVAPLLKQYNITLDIIGKGWPTDIRTKDICLNFKGFVPVLKDAVYGSIMIVPILTGSGMRMKILEAASMGLPIITTAVGVEGLGFIDNVSCLIADTPQSFANAIIQMISSDALRHKLASEAATVYIEKYSKKALSKVRNEIYDKFKE